MPGSFGLPGLRRQGVLKRRRQMLDPTQRRKYIFSALDYDLGAAGPENFIGATAYNLASGLWHNDPTLPDEIDSAEEIEFDCQEWLDLHTELLTADRAVEIRDDGSAVWDEEGVRGIERALSTGTGTMLADACAAMKRT
jgi:hypothetical protein